MAIFIHDVAQILITGFPMQMQIDKHNLRKAFLVTIDKLNWVKQYLSEPAYKRLILSPHKNLMMGLPH